MTEKPAASTMPPPSGARERPSAEKVTSLLDEGYDATPVIETDAALSELAGAILELGVAVLATHGLRDEDVGEELYHMLFELRSKLRGIYDALCRSPAREPAAARRVPEEAAIGAYAQDPDFGVFDEITAPSMLVQCLTPFYADEPLADGLEQLAAEMSVLAESLTSKSDMLSPEILHRVASGHEHRIRVLAAIARKTLLAVGRAA